MTDQTRDASAESEAAHSGIEFISAERLVFFSDAVVAIAITLLALALPVPHGATSHGIFTDLSAHRDAFLAFLISFVVIANHWHSHHRLYRHVVRIDRGVMTMNMFWLLLIVITPFATRIIAGGGAFGARFAIYAVIQIATILTFLAMSRHIRRNRLLRPGAPEPTSRLDDAAYLAVAGTFALSIPVALATNSQWTFAIWIASVLSARALRRLRSQDST